MSPRSFRAAMAAAGLLTLAACGTTPATMMAESPTFGARTESRDALRGLPAPAQRLDVAVFNFQDQTGQHRPNENFAEYSFAVTQGGASILINALRDAGGANRWFHVLERNRLADLLQERQIIRANRAEHLGADGQPLPPLAPLRNAGIMLTGGIIGYDSNVLTGGAGASFLGIGGSTEYRRDNVSVYLRAVSIASGEVLVSVTADKTIYSVALQGLANRYVGWNKLLQIEGGVTTNEPRQLAVRQAIEKAVHGMILDGADKGYWRFADEAQGRAMIEDYLATRDGEVPAVVSAEAPQSGPGTTSGTRQDGRS
ncbi:CsgG/HfaB family protein [Pseudoroseomonas globiformis]|uniref:CsgG/HfaB family protein n=1 Tax=Teichococcus globiformis TaxID=2307229 RepID=A0ABV7FXB6_9PROT